MPVGSRTRSGKTGSGNNTGRLLLIASGILFASCDSWRLDEADAARRLLILETVDSDFRGLQRSGVTFCLCSGVRAQPDAGLVRGEVSRKLLLMLQQATIPGTPNFVPCARCRFDFDRYADRGNQARIVIEDVSIAADRAELILRNEYPNYEFVGTYYLRREKDGWVIAKLGRMTET
jgi:hypothetical protein